MPVILKIPHITVILALICLIVIFSEFKSRDFGLQTIAGLLAIGSYLYISFSNMSLDFLQFLFYLSGLCLLLLEIFIPGIGILAIGGIYLLSLGFNLENGGFTGGMGNLLPAILTTGLIASWAYKGAKRSDYLSKFVLKNSLSSDRGYLSKAEPACKVGDRGESITILRPSGKIRIGEKTIEATAFNSFIDKNKKVIVKEIRNADVVVEENKDEAWSGKENI